MKLFRFLTQKGRLDRSVEQLEKSKNRYTKAVNDGLKLIEDEIESTRTFSEKMKNAGNTRFEKLTELILYSLIVSADLALLSEQITISKRRFEKLLSARMLALVIHEHLKDISNKSRDFKAELKRNGYQDLVQELIQVEKMYREIRKKHAKPLEEIRNKLAAHKDNDTITMINYLLNINPNDIRDVAQDVTVVNTALNRMTTKVYYKMIEEAKENKRKMGSK